MLYIYLSDSSIELIQTKKSLVSEEKIIACSRKILTDEFFESGTILKQADALQAISQVLKAGYPHEIKDHAATLVLPDHPIAIKRFSFPQQEVNQELVLTEAKKILPSDYSSYESFYKEIKSEKGVVILYTAIPINIILSYLKLFKEAGLELQFLSSASFSIYALLKPMIKKTDVILYADIDEQSSFYLLDSEGPILTFEKKLNPKTYASDFKNIINKIKEDNTLIITQIFVAGEKSLELNAQDLNKELGVTTFKIGQLLDTILESQNIKFETGGVPSVYFDKVLGLFNLKKMVDVPNFVSDIKSMDKDIKDNQFKKEVEEIKDMPPVVSASIVEYKKSGFSHVLRSKFFVIGVVGSIVLILSGAFLFSQNQTIKIPFLTRPTLTPTPTLIPTVTPTPTVDPNLKRDEIKLDVLNGTERTGFAKSTQEKLEKLGYKNIAVGNADRDDYPKTVIKVKEKTKKYLPLVLSDLASDFATSTVETLVEDSNFDFIIILGQK